jgi:NAD(P)-dependent dehydrogenase (short-subunit alcohol dehydrogenase family)
MPNSKIILITGGSSGIGFAIAQKFIAEGYTCIITGRNKTKLNQANHELGHKCFSFQYDMADIAGLPQFVSTIVSKFEKIDVLVNNAGINHKKALTEVTDEDFQNVIHINQTALFSLSREVIKVMLKQPDKGNIINISSMAAHYGIPQVVAYTASKTALEGMTRAMAVELSPMGIRVNCVAPGFIRTPMSSKALDKDPQRRNKVISRTPMGVLGQPIDVANAVFFLASKQASFITGEVIKVDGGNAIGF